MKNWHSFLLAGPLFLIVFSYSLYAELNKNSLRLSQDTSLVKDLETISEEALKDNDEDLTEDTDTETAEESGQNTVSENIDPVRVSVRSDMLRNIVKVECKNNNSSDMGTGVIQVDGDATSYEWEVYTNAHVIASGLQNGGSCSIFIPSPPDYYPTIEVPVSIEYVSEEFPDVDFAILKPISTEMAFFDFPFTACAGVDNTIGDSVRVYGYPGSGGSTLTVTEGIVSGSEYTSFGPVFKTSAKIDTGNSGGIAVNQDKGCSIGIPTWANAGEIEGLGYIQSWDIIYKAGDL